MRQNEKNIQDAFDQLLRTLEDNLPHSRIRSILITQVEMAKLAHLGSIK